MMNKDVYYYIPLLVNKDSQKDNKRKLKQKKRCWAVPSPWRLSDGKDLWKRWILSEFWFQSHCHKPHPFKSFWALCTEPIQLVLCNFSDNQLGFKKGVGCSYAIRAVRNIVDSYISGGSTTNLCAIDLSTAFDKVNHDALFLKLMKGLSLSSC